LLLGSVLFRLVARPLQPGVVGPYPVVSRIFGHNWSRSLDGRQNRYSYVTAGDITGFSGEAIRLKPPQSRLGIPLWCPPCGPVATSELEAQVEAKFHMYYFVLH
jgi:hypothetical protein